MNIDANQLLNNLSVALVLIYILQKLWAAYTVTIDRMWELTRASVEADRRDAHQQDEDPHRQAESNLRPGEVSEPPAAG